MSKKIYSRTIKQGEHTFLDRIKVQEFEGKRFIISASTIGTGGAMINCQPYIVTRVVAELIDGKGESPYTLEQ